MKTLLFILAALLMVVWTIGTFCYRHVYPYAVFSRIIPYYAGGNYYTETSIRQVSRYSIYRVDDVYLTQSNGADINHGAIP